MNDFGFIDYKKPLGQQDDMRSSSYKGHVYMTDTSIGNKCHLKFPESRKTYDEDPVLGSKWKSETKLNFGWKYGDSGKIRNPSLRANTSFIKPFEELKIHFIKRPLRPATSVSHQDYLWHPRKEPELPPGVPMPTPVATTKIVVDRSKPGFAKYLDPSATTQRLDYVAYTPDELMGSVAAKDNITFWNWDKVHLKSMRVFPERDLQMCDNFSAQECPKRRCEFTSCVKRVPNAGMTTEVRSNYLVPYTRAIDFPTSHLRHALIHMNAIPSSKKTEYNLYGSGERTEQYV